MTPFCRIGWRGSCLSRVYCVRSDVSMTSISQYLSLDDSGLKFSTYELVADFYEDQGSQCHNFPPKLICQEISVFSGVEVTK